MASTTPRLGLRKPAGADLVNVTTDISDNMDKLDAAGTKLTNGVAKSTADQVGLTNIEYLVDNLVLNVTTIAGRQYKVSSVVNIQTSDGATTIAVLLREGGTIHKKSHYRPSAGLHPITFNFEALLEPAAGAHTYQITVLRTAGAGSFDMINTDMGQHVMIEDVGAA